MVPAGAGMQWVATGWEMFKAAPGPWVGIFLVYIIVTGVVSLLPFLGILNVVLDPILTAGLVAACEAQRTGRRRRVEHLIVGFRTGRPATWRWSGVFYLIGVLLVIVVVGGGGLAAMLPFILAASAGGDQFTMTPAMIGIIAICVVLLFGLAMPLAFAMAWAPALVSCTGWRRSRR